MTRIRDRRPGARPRRRGDAGYVTVVVLTFAGLLAALVAATLNVARPSIGQALINIDDMQADGLLDAGVASAGLALFGGNRPSQTVDGYEMALETGALRLTVTPEGGRIDLNGAPRQVLSGLYEAVGTGALKPDEFAARVMDWRDRNKKARPGGADTDDYEQLGLDYGPRNGPFLSVEELMLLPGMTEADYGRLAPYLTVFNPTGEIDPAGASVEALLAVPNMTETEAANIKAAFANPQVPRRDRNRLIRPYRSFLSPQGNDVFRVVVEARLKNGYTKSVETVLMSGFRRVPYYVLYWRVLYPTEAAS